MLVHLEGSTKKVDCTALIGAPDKDQPARFRGTFLAMADFHQIIQSYPKCSANAETQLFS